MPIGKPNSGERSFPGRLTLDEWLVTPLRVRNRLIWRAQCDIVGSFRSCVKKRCRRERACCGDDPHACERRVRRLRTITPKTVWREMARLTELAGL